MGDIGDSHGDSQTELWKDLPVAIGRTRARARARRTDPDTSHAAASSVERITEKQAAVLWVLCTAPGGMTDEELVRHFNTYVGRGPLPKMTDSSIRTRRSELVRKGLVEDTTLRERMTTGRMAKVWAITPEGRTRVRGRE